MQKINYQKELLKFMGELQSRPSLLLHCCCAPCASACLELLTTKFNVTCYYYNPNITSIEEYNKRKAELIKLTKIFNVNLICEDFNPEPFYSIVKGHEQDAEGGARCEFCIAERLKKTRNLASEGGYNYWATTLTISPHKNSQFINQTGIKLAGNYLPADFKKNNGFKRSIELCEKYNIYRQTYCGCEFSLNAKE